MFLKLANWWQQRVARVNTPEPLAGATEGSLAEREFDTEWYLAANPDVAAAGVDPWEHYQRHGKAEGRLPCRNRAPALEHGLWRGAHAVVLPRLQRLLNDPHSNTLEQLTARWALARWYVWQADWQAALDTLTPQGKLIALEHPGPALLVIDIANRQPGANISARLIKQAQEDLQARFPKHPDTPLAKANVLHLTSGQGSQRLAVINHHFQAQGLQPIALADDELPLHLDNLASNSAKPRWHDLSRVRIACGEGLPRATGFALNHSSFTPHHLPFTADYSTLQWQYLSRVRIACGEGLPRATGFALNHPSFTPHHLPFTADYSTLQWQYLSRVRTACGEGLPRATGFVPCYSTLQWQYLSRVRTAFGGGLPRATGLATHHSPLTTHHSLPLISVIIPLYNAQHTVATALRSLFDQQGVRLEIIVVDDASQDGSAEVIEWCQANTPAHISLHLIRHSVNQGAYAARNTGLAVACGEFITTHDSDDWSYPQKLALQCQALLNDPSLNACLSHWVRVTPELLFHRWRLDEYGWVYPNMSSLMFRRSVRDRLGYWDNVSVNADSEYRLRIEAAYGPESLQEVLPGVPLAFGRADEGSLSQHTRSHLASQFAGMRFHYMQAAQNWHQQARSPNALYMPQTPEGRLFVAPQAMLRSTAPANTYHHDYERVIDSALFDAGWYLERYIDLQQVVIEPLCHFWESGAQEGRDPGPNFSTSGYLRANPAGLPAGKHPLVHYLSQESPDIQQALPIWEGQQSFAGRPTVMLCGHQAGGTLFGAERSLLDVLEAMGELRWNVVVTLPEANNVEYEQSLLSRCKALAVLPYGWWQVGRVASDDTVAHFQALLKRFNVQAVHGNTVVLQEPYVAARREGIAMLVHIRELPAHDTALCDLLGATADEVVAHVHRHADVIIANSHCVAQAFSLKTGCDGKATPVSVVPNTIEMTPLLALPDVSFMANGRVRVGMLSSNVAKKGLADVEAMATHLQTLAPQVEVVLYGPLTAAIKSLQHRQAQGQAPGNLIYAGYVDAPATALAELHIVVNLSRFQESFGRTVLEAMAAGRPVVAYNWGALSELVQSGKTGYLVPYATPLKAAQQVAKLAKSLARCVEMGQAGRTRAQRCFGASTLRNALANAYEFSQVPEFINTSPNG
ncbi:MAG: glycosyltransferase [Halomonas sp.]|nr:glycosyltransferase [Halomonas sp.]MBP5980586.1 glycosyltransferase [Halomonas sp.]